MRAELWLVGVLAFVAIVVLVTLNYESMKEDPEGSVNVEEMISMLSEEEIERLSILLADLNLKASGNDPFIFQNFDPRLLPDNCSLRDKYTWFHDQDGKFIIVGPEGIWYDGDFSANAGQYGEER